MFNKEKYEKADIKEQVKVFSQTEPGYVFVCSRKRYRKPVYKWNNYYFRLIQDIPKTITDLRNNLICGNPTDSELQTLLKFIQTDSDSGFNVSTYTLIKIVWNSFHKEHYAIK